MREPILSKWYKMESGCEFQQIISFVHLLECHRVISAQALLNELVEGLLSARWFKAKQNGFHLTVLNCGARRTSQEVDLPSYALLHFCPSYSQRE